MRHEILDAPEFGHLRFLSETPGETLIAEAGAMVSMSAGVEIKTAARGGLMKAAKRSLLGKESLFQNTFTTTEAGQEIILAPAPEGDVKHRTLAPNEIVYLQSGAYLAHIGKDLVLDTQWGGVKGFFSGLMFLLKITGPGDLFYGSYGAIHEIDVSSALTVDTGHIVGFTEGLEYKVGSFKGVKGFFFSGEGLVCNFSGAGKIWVQTRNAGSLASFLEPFRPVQKRSS